MEDKEFREFLDKVSEELKERIPGLETEIKMVNKPQGESYLGLSAREPGKAVCPVFDMRNQFSDIKEGLPFDIMMNMLCEKIVEAEKITAVIDPKEIENYEISSKHLVLSLIPKKGNEEILQSIPHKEIEDLALYYRLDYGGDFFVTVDNNLLERFGVTKEQLHEDAVRNSEELHPAQIRTIYDSQRYPLK